ncbi:MAG: magnesium transporter CorA family protein, partial [Streptococcus salivarius]|nr:magnesium transporter CorA family protein [Streptococcus salivarius]
MFIEKELGYKRHWINIDSDIISEQSYLYTKYDIDQETIEYA